MRDPAAAVRASSVSGGNQRCVQLEKPDADATFGRREGGHRTPGEPGFARNPRGLPITPSCTISQVSTPRLTSPSRSGWATVHERCCTTSARLRSKVAAALARQIAWRDFFADVLFHRPDAVSKPIRTEFADMPTDDPDRTTTAARRLAAWKEGKTGYPLVDAGMRQLQAEGWMHNRVRMVVASFLIKDLHIGWWHGADWFMERLRDGDIAQNQLNWQWVAGCGTDAAPYFRIFNPTGQAEKFDPDGTGISGAMSRNWRSCRSTISMSLGLRRTGFPTGTASRSWTMRSSARRRWTATPSSRAGKAAGVAARPRP